MLELQNERCEILLQFSGGHMRVSTVLRTSIRDYLRSSGVAYLICRYRFRDPNGLRQRYMNENDGKYKFWCRVSGRRELLYIAKNAF